MPINNNKETEENNKAKRGRKPTGKNKDSTSVTLKKDLKDAITSLCKLNGETFTYFMEEAAKARLHNYKNNEALNLENKIIIPFTQYEEITGFKQSAILSKIRNGALEEGYIHGHKCILINANDRMATFFEVSKIKAQQKVLVELSEKNNLDNYVVKEKMMENSDMIEILLQEVKTLRREIGLDEDIEALEELAKDPNFDEKTIRLSKDPSMTKV